MNFVTAALIMKRGRSVLSLKHTGGSYDYQNPNHGAIAYHRYYKIILWCSALKIMIGLTSVLP